MAETGCGRCGKPFVRPVGQSQLRLCPACRASLESPGVTVTGLPVPRVAAPAMPPSSPPQADPRAIVPRAVLPRAVAIPAVLAILALGVLIVARTVPDVRPAAMPPSRQGPPATPSVSPAIFNVHLEPHPDRVIVTWETDVRSDSRVDFGLTARCERTATNRAQISETIHDVLVEGLLPDTEYRYTIVCTATAGGGRTTSSVQTLRTARRVTKTREPSGLENLLRSYVDKLTRMTPDEREKLKHTIEPYRWVKRPPDESLKKELLSKAGTIQDFYKRLVALRNWVGPGHAPGIAATEHLEREFCVNKLQAVRRLDRSLAEYAARNLLTPELVRRPLSSEDPQPARGAPTRSPGPTTAPPDLEELLRKGRDLARTGSPEYVALLVTVREHASRMAAAASSASQKARVLRLAGSSMVWLDRSPSDLSKARRHLERSFVLDPDARTLEAIADALSLEGNGADEIKCLEKAFALEPTDAGLRWQLGIASMRSTDAARRSSAFSHVKAAIGMNAAYRQALKSILLEAHSRLAHESVSLVLEIIEKCETDALSDAAIEHYAQAFKKDASLVLPFALCVVELADFPTILMMGAAQAGGVVTQVALVLGQAAMTVIQGLVGGFSATPAPSPSGRSPGFQASPR